MLKNRSSSASLWDLFWDLKKKRRSGCWSSYQILSFSGLWFPERHTQKAWCSWCFGRFARIPKKKPGKIYRPVGSPHFCPLDVPKKKYVKSIHWRKPNWKRLPTSSSPGSWSHGSSPTGIPRPIDCHLFFVRSSDLSNILQKIRIMIFRIQKIRQTLDSQRRDCCHRYCSTLLWRHHDTRV